MSQQQSFWDFLEAGEVKSTAVEPADRVSAPPPTPGPGPRKKRVAAREQEDKERSRRQTFKKLRASGHWLTLLRVARTIAQPFTLNDISVAVWQACPEFFGMKGYAYPDNHKVHYILYGDRGLIAKGLMERVSQGLFRVPAELDLEALTKSSQEESEESPA